MGLWLAVVAKEGKRHHDQLRAICDMVKGPVSAEVLSLDHAGMVAEARELAAIAPNIVVKVPVTTDGLKTVKALRPEGMRFNVTLIFSPLQALLAAKAGASFVSPFVGRLDDIGHPGMEIVDQMVQIFDNYDWDCEVLVASVRSPQHILEAALLGAHVCTVPAKVFDQMIHHPLTDSGLDKFLADAKKTPR